MQVRRRLGGLYQLENRRVASGPFARLNLNTSNARAPVRFALLGPDGPVSTSRAFHFNRKTGDPLPQDAS